MGPVYKCRVGEFVNLPVTRLTARLRRDFSPKGILVIHVLICRPPYIPTIETEYSDMIDYGDEYMEQFHGPNGEHLPQRQQESKRGRKPKAQPKKQPPKCKRGNYCQLRERKNPNSFVNRIIFMVHIFSFFSFFAKFTFQNKILKKSNDKNEPVNQKIQTGIHSAWAKIMERFSGFLAQMFYRRNYETQQLAKQMWIK